MYLPPLFSSAVKNQTQQSTRKRTTEQHESCPDNTTSGIKQDINRLCKRAKSHRYQDVVQPY